MVETITRITEIFAESIEVKMATAEKLSDKIDLAVEKIVAKKLNFSIEPVSTQIIPRDRHVSACTPSKRTDLSPVAAWFGATQFLWRLHL